MTPQERKVFEQALEALEREARGYAVHDELQIPRSMRDAITAIKEVLAQPEQIPPSAYSNTHQPEQEPVAWVFDREACMVWWNDKFTDIKQAPPNNTPLYTTPPQRTWVGLTDEEIDYYIVHRFGVATKKNLVELIRLCEAKLKEKNHG